MEGREIMRIAIVGLGYVGATAAACLASEGHSVIGVDVSEQKVNEVNEGKSPFVEPGIDELLATAVSEGRLRAARTLPPIDSVEIIIVCVGTPSKAGGEHDMSAIVESTRQIALAAANSKSRTTIAFRSTFRPGTMETLITPIFEDHLGADFRNRIELVYNPEFLRESSAINDFFAPPKVVLGTEDGRRSQHMIDLHIGIDAPFFETGFREAEITKFIDNTWHAVKVTFANEIGRICNKYNVDSSVAHEIFAADTKLNISSYYTRPGGAFGGSCLPKDVRAMQHLSHSAGTSTPLIDSLIKSNELHKSFQVSRVTERITKGSRLLVAGLAFKYGTDDLRESPNVGLVAELLERGYPVRVFDPSVSGSELLGQNLAAVLGSLPNLQKIMIEADQISEADFDFLVVNNDTVNHLPSLALPVLDLRKISS